MDYIERSFQCLARAIEFFSTEWENICLPMKHTFAFDLILVPKGKGIMMRVKVIQTESKSRSGAYVVNLRKSGGYTNAKEHKADFDPSMCDFLFIISPDGIYVIPSRKITQKRAISLSMFEEFKCKPNVPS